MLRAIIRILSCVLCAITLLWWCRAGYNKGWTKTSVQEWKYDEITEISYPENSERFVPGVDFLAAGIALALVLLAISYLVRKSEPSRG
jgi:hypothetical protein